MPIVLRVQKGSQLTFAEMDGNFQDLDLRLRNIENTNESVTWNEITGKPDFFSGSYDDLTDKPILFSGSYNDLTNTPNLFSGSYDDLIDTPVIPTDINELTDEDGLLDSGIINETDPIFSASVAAGITDIDTDRWSEAYSWGDHSTQGYITSYTETDTLDDVVSRGNATNTTAIIPFLYDNQSSFPNASIFHGAIAHSHADGAMYFAHGGVWLKLANDSDIANSANWDTAYSWGDHSTQGYITSSISIGDLSDVSDASASTGQVLKWNGAQWAPASDSVGDGSGGITYADISVTTNPVGSASLSYDNTTGTFTYTPPDLSSYLTDYTVTQLDVTQHEAALSINESQVTFTSSFIELSNLSATTVTESGNGSLVYNNVTGLFTYTPPDLSGYLSSETDPIVGAVNGLVKSDGAGNISAAVAGTDYSTFDGAFSSLTGTPTTLSGYGITDGYTDSDVDAHLNTSTATAGQILSWTGTVYDWVADARGIALADLSVTQTAVGTAGLSYNNTSGVFTYTPPDLSSYLTSVAWGDLTGSPTSIGFPIGATINEFSIDGTLIDNSNTAVPTENAVKTYVDNAIASFDNIGNFTLGSSIIDTDDSSAITMTPAVVMSSDLTVENDIIVNNDLRVNGDIVTGSVGDPEILSESDILLTAATRVTVTQSPLKMASFTTAERDALTAENGDTIYNTTTNKFQGYANGTWVDLH